MSKMPSTKKPPADEHGHDEDRDVRPHEADDAGTDPDHAEDEIRGQRWRAARTAADELEEPAGDEEAAGQVDDGVHAGVAVADHEEAEDHGDDAAGQVPAPHLLELRADGIADGDLVVCEYVRHEHPPGE